MATGEIPAPHFSDGELEQRIEELELLSASEEPNLREIAVRTSEIPQLKQRVIQRVNAVGTGLRYRISEVDHAVAFLGARQMQQLVGQLRQDTQRLRDIAQTNDTRDDSA